MNKMPYHTTFWMDLNSPSKIAGTNIDHTAVETNAHCDGTLRRILSANLDILAPIAAIAAIYSIF